MNARTAACAALLALAALTTGCSSTEADPAACKAAMQKQYADAIDSGKEGSRPAACDGIDDKTLQKYATDIMADQLGDTLGSATPDAELSPPDVDDIEASLDAISSDLDDALKDLDTSAP